MNDDDRPVAVDFAALEMDRPSSARMYDYWLGGSHNFHADREAAARLAAQTPDVIPAARANRMFLGRAVRHVAEAGVTQFLDLGSGIPAQGNVHEVAQQYTPGDGPRVVYVDMDPVAYAHAELVLRDARNVGVVRADLRDLDGIAESGVARRLLRWDEPICVLAVSVLHFVPGDLTPWVTKLRDRMAPGSYLVISHGTWKLATNREGDVEKFQQEYQRTTTPLTLRAVEEVAALFDGFDLVAPGLVSVAEWPRPEPTLFPDREVDLSGFVAGVGRRLPGPA